MRLIVPILILSVLCFFPANAQKTKEIKPLKGTAPYGVEKRPMPEGADLQKLLPKQVGPYTRMLLEESERRGVTPTSIQVDGPSVYATYKSGAKEVFVEFAVSSDAASAQEALIPAAADAVGKFPRTRARVRLALNPVTSESITNSARSTPGRVASITSRRALKVESQISTRSCRRFRIS